MNSIHKVALTQPKYLKTLVENRSVYNLKNCELNIYESYQQSWEVPLSFSDLVITSMIRGKKVMHLEGRPDFEYLPGESVILPAHELMHIDFPEAEADNPTQCIALCIDADYLNGTVDYLNEYYNSDKEQSHNWKLQFSQYHFSNNNEITDLINKIIKICSSSDKAKNVYADLSLKELLIRLLQSQHLFSAAGECENASNETRLHHILHYIQEHLGEKIAIDELCRKAYLSRNLFFKWFREQCGISPLDYINEARIKQAKQLLADPRNDIRTVGLQCGFNDVNYFIRVFRKVEGITPGTYQTFIQPRD